MGTPAKPDVVHCPDCGRKICGGTRTPSTRPDAPKLAKCSRNDLCHRAPGQGTAHKGIGRCIAHWGNTNSANQAAAMHVARQVMIRAYGAPVEDISAEEALSEEIGRTVGHVRWLADKIVEITGGAQAVVIDMTTGDVIDASDAGGNDNALVYGLTEHESQEGGVGGGFDRHRWEAVPNIWLKLYQAERKHLADICKVAIAAGIETRRLDWAEAQAGRLIEAIEAFAESVGLQVDDPAVQQKAAAALELVVSPKAS